MTDLDPKLASQLEFLLAAGQRDTRTPSVVVAVAERGEVLWSGARGRLDGRTDGPATTVDTQYRIGSITKTFTAVLVMRLRDAGRLGLEDRLGDHLSGTGYEKATIAQLLSHSAGLPAETSGPWWERTAGVPWQELLSLMGPNVFAPGQRHHYSNLGYAVLGALVAQLTGRAWWDVVRDDLLVPLGMTRTSYGPTSPSAPGWAVHPELDLLHPEPTHDAQAMAPAGQLWSTVQDLSRWAGFLAAASVGRPASSGHTGGLLSPETVREMCAPRVVVDDPGQPWAAAHGLGWQLLNLEGRRYAGHGGSMPGFLAQFWVELDGGRGAVVLSNSTSGLGPAAITLLDTVVRERPLPILEWTATAPAQEEAELAGTWFWGPRPHVLRVRDGELLLGEQGDSRAARFTRTADGRWIGLDGYFAGEELRAVRDVDGVVSHLDIASFRWTRLPYDPAGDIPGGVEGGWR